ncbi:conserved hypothetical protein [uncultured delta proteobacterium]|uniref:Uncharacterized protein n=1 Tax=uncultured delta proteobacterium TaxID=34034 RepID=A0A212JI27_9DELT|nr:conserved hypothetical protein [uncultured delta proteobacterium]
MAVTALLGQLPWAWRIALGAAAVLVVGGAYGAGVKKGFDAGHTAAKALGDAAYAALERDHARQYAAAMAEYAARLRREAEKALDAGAALARAKEDHAAIQRSLQARITAATRGSVHRFSPEFVRLFNEAVGADAPAAGKPPPAAGTAAASGPGIAAGSGVRRGDGSGGTNNLNVFGEAAPERPRAPGARGAVRKGAAGGTGAGSGHGDEPDASATGPAVTATASVTERDVLAYIAYYGRRCRDIEAQLGALIHLVEGKVVNGTE